MEGSQVRRISMLAVLAAGCLLAPAMAQNTLDWPTGEFVPYYVDSAALSNLERSSSVVFSQDIHVQDAAWIRLYFKTATLQPGSYVRMTSLYDGEVQELDADDLAMWHFTSAYFNGDTVRLELVAAPGTTDNRIVLDRVAVEIVSGGLRGPCAGDDCGICNNDDRVLSNELWSGRLMPVGCTGSIYNTDSCVVSAGHCADGGWDDVIEFNVPDSTSNCTPRHPGVADQFPITSHQFVNGGVGNDWAVMTTGTNSNGETAYQRYGVYRPIAGSPASVGQQSEVWGYGVDNDNPTRSQVQQYSNGSINGRYSSYYTYNDDVTYGNSGSALVVNGSIVGIVTHCSFYCGNVATRVDLSAFVSARENLCPGGTCNVVFTSQPQDVTVCAGDIAQFNVVVQDAYLMDYQWRIGTTDLVDDGVHIFGANTDTLTIVGVTGADEATNYNCLVTNTFENCSEASSNASLTVDTNVANILQQPQDATVTEGDPVLFSVSVENNTLYNYQWRMNGSDLSDGGRFAGTQTQTLLVNPTQLGDDGAQFDCVITYQLGNQCSTVSDAATLTVNPGGNNCPEDLDGDGTIGLGDLSIMLANYGSTNANPEDGDLDGDGDVDLSDLSVLLAVYGQDCPTR